MILEEQKRKQRIEDDLKKAEQEEHERKRRYKDNLKNQRESLTEQVKEKQVLNIKQSGMSDIEMKLNADRLKKINML